MKRAIALIIILFALTASAAKRSYRVEAYDRWAKLRTDTLFYKGMRYYQTGEEPDSALLCFTIAANRYYERSLSEEELRYVIRAMNGIGCIYIFYYFDYEQAFSSLNTARELAEKHHFMGMLPTIYLNLANIYQTEGDAHGNSTEMVKALQMYEQAYESALQARSWDTAIRCMLNMVDLSFNDEMSRRTLPSAEKFLRLELPDSVLYRDYARKICLALQAFVKADYPLSANLLRQSDELIDSHLAHSRYCLLNHANLAEVYRRMNKREEERAELREVLRLAREIGAKDFEMEAYRELWRAYSAAGLLPEARAFEYSYLRLKDSLMSVSKLEAVGSMKFQSQLRSVSEQVKRESARRKLWMRMAGGLVAVVAIIAVLSVLLWRKNRELNATNKMLYRRYVDYLKQKEEQRENLEAQKKYQGSSLDEERAQQLALDIERVLSDAPEICRENFTLQTLADRVGANYKYVSQVINEHYGKNFSQLLAEYRVNEACRRLRDRANYGQYTIEAIAASVGFKSRSNFVTNFKRITGLNPSAYQRLAAAESEGDERVE